MKRANKKKSGRINIFSNINITLKLGDNSRTDVNAARVLVFALAVKLLTMSSSEVSELMQALGSLISALAG